MKHLIWLTTLFIASNILGAEYPEGREILRKIDQNLISKTTKSQTTMIVKSRRATRTMVSINWSEGTQKAFSEYLSPPRDKGTKMLKEKDNLWIYEPNTDRIIQISGNMLKQSVMGSDLSYEDFMEETEMEDMYNATVTGEEKYTDRDCWILQLTAKKENVSYPTRKVLVDKQRYIPLYEERYAKNGKLLKSTKVEEVMKVGNRWYPKRIIYKDELKEGAGTVFIIDSIELDIAVPQHIFSKVALKQ